MIKNYTSSVPADVTVARIEKALAKAGANSIHKHYSQTGTIEALVFTIRVGDSPELPVRLPVNEQAVAEAMWAQYCKATRHRRKTQKDFLEQASRTAWKLMQDWVEVQLTLIIMRQAEFHEVFLPYIWNGKQTVYHQLKDRGLQRLALPEHTEP